MSRLEVLKTYKIYIGGAFPRTESGRFYPLKDRYGKTVANICLSSRKDFRNAVVEARKAQSGWSEKTAYNRSQILYRIAETLESRKTQFIAEMQLEGFSASKAKLEVELSIDRIIYFAGWCDKYQQIFSAVNPVAGSYFNFSVPEPTGVVAILPQESPLLGMVSATMPVIAGGNTCVYLAHEKFPLSAVNFAEVLNSSDVPGGVINILTGMESELAEFFANHMDVNACVSFSKNKDLNQKLESLCTLNVKRFRNYSDLNINSESFENPYLIQDFQEIKTTWHPIENIAPGKASY